MSELIKYEIVIKNTIQCRKCGDIIESTQEHEFRRCKCGAVAVDGAFKYLRRCGNLEDMIELSVCKEVTMEEAIAWMIAHP